METISLDEFEQKLKDNFNSLSEAEFICPSCKTVQTPQDLIDNGAGKDLDEVNGFIGFSCVGRFNNKKTGCDWTLGGFFQIHELEITSQGKNRPCFKLNIK